MIFKFLVVMAMIAGYDFKEETIYAQFSSNPIGSCLKVNWNLDTKDPIEVTANYVRDGKHQETPFYFAFVSEDGPNTKHYNMVDAENNPTGETVEIQRHGDITKVVHKKENGDFVRNVCFTHEKVATKSQYIRMKRLCNEKDQQRDEQKDCPFQ